jgi:hypothetical protein
MRYVLLFILLPLIILAGPIYVSTWPDRIKVDDGVAIRPTPEMCRAAGYELIANKPQAEIDAELAEIATQAAAAQTAQTAQSNKVQSLRDAYADATMQLCTIAGIPVVRVMSMQQIQDMVLPLLTTEYAGQVNGLLILMTNLEGKLTREDGADALDRI